MSFPVPSPLTLVKLSVLLLGALNLVLLARPPSPSPSPAKVRYVHVDADPPLRLRHLPTPPLGPRTLVTEETVHYPIAGPLADAEWASLVPTGHHGVVLLDDDDGDGDGAPKPYVVTMFHTLHCLDHIRRAIVDGPPGDGAAGGRAPRFHVQHCFNYLRQMTLCAADTRLNPINHVLDGKPATDGIGLDYVCRDWGAVYDAFEANLALNRTMAFLSTR